MQDGYLRVLPNDSLRIPTGCQYCAVGCGYNAFLVGESSETAEFDGMPRLITPAMRNQIRLGGKTYQAAVAPDVLCDLNKGNHSVRGGSQGENLVTHDGKGRSTKQRLTSPMVRLADGKLHKITWSKLNEIMARLVIRATRLATNPAGNKIRIPRRAGLGVKVYEYQYLENTYAATKLFYSVIGTPNVAYHDRPSAADSSPGLADTGFRAHGFAYDDVRYSDVLMFVGTNPYENQSVFFMQYCVGKKMIVVDPRRTATADYAVRTGGLHLQPTKLGADSLVLHALAREIIRKWIVAKTNGAPIPAIVPPELLAEFPSHPALGSQGDIDNLKVEADQASGTKESQRTDRRRRASRALSFEQYVNEFLMVGGAGSEYTLDNAEAQSGIAIADLRAAADLLFDANATAEKQPRVGLFYEKGMIWGFNYHNTSAVGALGLLLRAYSGVRGRFVGRVGGHQKGWAESRSHDGLDFVTRPGKADVGYPYFVANDRYSDSALRDLKAKRTLDTDEIRLKHNLDNHVFGIRDSMLVDPNPDGLPNGFVKLKNDLVTRKKPDVRLLWLIGNNYFGQTNDAAWKREQLERRRGTGARLKLPASTDVDEVVDVLGKRIDSANGIVLVHQDIFANPTTEFCDIVIPAAGWGEDDFVRYNAQRRLKLYGRFQDMPLDEADEIGGDPMDRIDDFVHSPKPDWVIIRDIARAIGREVDLQRYRKDQADYPQLRDDYQQRLAADPSLATREEPPKVPSLSGRFEAHMRSAFPWCKSSEVCDEMAQRSNRAGMVGDIYRYGRLQGMPVTQGVVQRVLGKKSAGEPQDALAPMLSHPDYSVDGQGEVHGNSVATNGVLLPAKLDKDGRLKGTLSQGPAKDRLFFINAPWSQIKESYEQMQPGADELFITNGRVNHLWNNMFHHIRNEYVNERYPEDLPGTVLEVNPDWAGQQNPPIQNGQVIDVVIGEQQFRAIASLQDSVPESGAFAMFSYPVRNDVENGLDESKPFNFNGYVNNITSGYADGINPIGALKYGKAKIQPAENPTTNVRDWVFPRDFPHRVKRLGPTFAQRNRIGPAKPPIDLANEARDRLDWEMRELIVTKGLPRALIRREFQFATRPHILTSGPSAGEPTGRFWRMDGLTPQAFLELSVFGERMDDELVNRVESDMPSGMLAPDELPRNPLTDRLIAGIKTLMSDPDEFNETALAKVQDLLDALIDIAHRAVVEQFDAPDTFLDTLKSNAAVRDRLMARLNNDVRRMEWRLGGLIDEWHSGELEIARRWYWEQ